MIPNKQHWEKAWVGQDEANAFDHFHGKTLEEAEDMIHDHSEYYCEDFWWMPEIPPQRHVLSGWDDDKTRYPGLSPDRPAIKQ